VDLSGFIFVALAVAWAVYLVPKALKHHDDVVKSRSIDRFSHTMRVLARREPVSTRDARLVVAPGRASSATVVETKAARPTPTQLRARRAAASKAAQRRRRVLGSLLVIAAAVVGLAAAHVIGWTWTAAPAALIVGWLVACRLMVKKERAVSAPVIPSIVSPAEGEDDDPETVIVERNEQGFDEVAPGSDTTSIPAVVVGDPLLWDPLPVTLPTYVTKPVATRRSVRTIALDDTGVWTSGHSAADSKLAREADAARPSTGDADGQRAVGS
jgi:hypothetical protein